MNLQDKETAERYQVRLGWNDFFLDATWAGNPRTLDAGTRKNMQVVRAFSGKASEDRWHQNDMLLHDTGAHW